MKQTFKTRAYEAKDFARLLDIFTEAFVDGPFYSYM
jgi:hypothetical protein